MKKVLFSIALAVVIIMAACQKKAVSQNDASCAALANTKWKLIQLNGSTTFPDLPKDITLQFDTARASGYAGCNSFFGKYSATGESIRFENLASTKMFCQPTMQLEDSYLKALNTANAYRIDKKHLHLSSNKQELAVFEFIQ